MKGKVNLLRIYVQASCQVRHRLGTARERAVIGILALVIEPAGPTGSVVTGRYPGLPRLFVTHAADLCSGGIVMNEINQKFKLQNHREQTHK
jgi:hypothetical protein